MLVRIKEIKGVGLLHDVHSPGIEFKKLALVYGENGRGKSTIGAILSSCASRDSRLVSERATIDGSLAPSVSLLFEGNVHANFAEGSWSGVQPEILVFDAAFTQRHVHSGVEVTADNRKNLLDFALGADAVAARAKEQRATADRVDAAASRRNVEQELAQYTGDMPLRAFRNLDPVEDVDAAIAEAEERLAVARREAELRRQPLPATVPLPTLDIAEVFEVLGRGLEELHTDAEAKVAAHFERIDAGGIAQWASDGQQYDDGTNCPYCGQDTSGVELIRMYRTHFSAQYKRLQDDVNNAIDHVARQVTDEVVAQIRTARERANERLAFWKEYAGTSPIDDDRDELVLASVRNVRDKLDRLLAAKAAAIGDPTGDDADRSELAEQWQQVTQIYSDFNDTINQKRDSIDRYLAALASEDASTTERTIVALRAAKTRHSAPVEGLFEQLEVAEAALQAAEEAKSEARDTLSTVMSETLSKYRESINSHLDRLGARFKITEIKTNFHGQAPRTDYGIELRGKDVAVSGGTPSFATALSEGDKRTMAFAFFAASIDGDGELASKIVVVDDPMSSLDHSRRDYTRALLVDIASRAGQLVVLAHDAYFLRELEAKVKRSDSSCEISHAKLVRTKDDYTDLSKLDLARECESAYARNYRATQSFIDAENTDHIAAGVALRPLLEGHLHRRFPGRLPDAMLGKVLDQIDGASGDDPLQHAKSTVPELRELNDFAGQFHHDTNPDFSPSTAPDATSVASYAKRALALVHGAGEGAAPASRP